MSSWSSAGKSQEWFMLKDECLIVNYNDEVIGSDNKYNVHKFVSGQPKGVLHRAFSVMLFDAEGRLLLQQRASSKVTFPGVWTNTCCSHPLHGQTPSEVDGPETVKAGASTEPTGVKHAAVRKLQHELGIAPGALDPARFKYMGRVHYWAADTLTHGSAAPWGEHEVDYLLLYQLPSGVELTLAPHPEEVSATAWVTRDELQSRMAADGVLWSPWFRVIVNEHLLTWWRRRRAHAGRPLTSSSLRTPAFMVLPHTLNHARVCSHRWTDLPKALKLRPFERICRFDAPPEHRKSGGCHDGVAATELAELCAKEAAFKDWSSPARRTLTLAEEREARRRDLTSQHRSAAAAKANKQCAYGKVRPPPAPPRPALPAASRHEPQIPTSRCLPPTALHLQVPTHAHSKLAQLLHPAEVAAALWFKFGGGGMKASVDTATEADLSFCDAKLGEVSRSFCAVSDSALRRTASPPHTPSITAAASLAVAAVQVIRQLPPNLVVDIMVFYLVLRALDTIEDDMQAFKGAEHKKVANPPARVHDPAREHRKHPPRRSRTCAPLRPRHSARRRGPWTVSARVPRRSCSRTLEPSRACSTRSRRARAG